jgi:hypothetical protein
MLKNEDGYFEHDGGSARVCKMFDSSLPVWRVRVTERATEEGAQYWAWWENKDETGIIKRAEGFELIWRRRFLVDMCFTYGAKVEEERGRGKLCAVDIEPLEEVTP